MRLYVRQICSCAAMLTKRFYHAARTIGGKRMKYAISLLLLVLLGGVSQADDATTTMSLEDRLQPGAITLTVSDFGVPPRNSYLRPTLTFSFENKSGVALEAAILSYGYSAGPCSLSPNASYFGDTGIKGGMPVVDRQWVNQHAKDAGSSDLSYFPKSGKLVGSIVFDSGNCASDTTLSGLAKVPVTVSIVLFRDLRRAGRARHPCGRGGRATKAIRLNPQVDHARSFGLSRRWQALQIVEAASPERSSANDGAVPQ